MDCILCGRENPSQERYCVNCGTLLSGDEDVASEPDSVEPGETVDHEQIQEELSDIRFAIQELDAVQHETAFVPQVWQSIRDRFVERLGELEDDLVLIYGSFPLSDAVKNLRDFLDMNPRHVQARIELGRMYQHLGRPSPAIEQCLLAAVLAPELAEPHFMLAQLYALTRRDAAALYEYRASTYLEVETVRSRDAENSARSLEQRLISEIQPPAINETRSRLDYLISTLKEFSTGTDGDSPTSQLLVDRYSLRLESIVVPEVPEPVAAAVLPEVATPPLPPPPPTPSPVVSAPREPFDWGGFWSALFSERALTAILGFGVLLVAVSSLIMLISLWGDFHWTARQGFLLMQFLMFLGVGYTVRERLKLQLSGLAVITIAALWVPLNVGALVFEFIPAPAERLLPGIALPLDLPMVGWLIIAAVCAPVWAAFTYQFRGHLMMQGTVASSGATVALFLAVLGVGWQWSVASLAVLTIPLMFIRHSLRQTSFKLIAGPLYWTAHAVLVGVSSVLLAAWILNEVGSYPLALVGMAGAGLYALVYRYSPTLKYDYLFTGLPVISLLFALAESEVLPLRYYDSALIGVSIAYLIVGRMREKAYDVEILQTSRWPILQPAYIIAYLSIVVAVTWPSFDPVSRMAALYGAAAITAVSALWWNRANYIYLAGLFLTGAFFMTLDNVGLDISLWAIPLSSLAVAYFLGAMATRRVSSAAGPLFAMSYMLTLTAMGWAFVDSTGAAAPWSIPIAAVIFTSSAILIHRRGHPSLDAAIEWIAGGMKAKMSVDNVRQIGVAGFGLATAVLLPLWVSLMLNWQGAEGAVHAYNLLGWAFVSAFVAHFALRRYAQLYTYSFLGFGSILAISAALVGFAESQIVLMEILYSVAALGVLYRFFIPSEVPIYVAVVILLAPFGLTLDIVGVAPGLWSTPFIALAVAYVVLGLVLKGRVPSASAPFLNAGYGLSAMAVVGSVAEFLALPADANMTLFGQRILVSIGPFIASGIYAFIGYRDGDRRFGHISIWTLSVALGMTLVITPLSLQYSAIAVAVASAAYVLAGGILPGIHRFWSGPTSSGPSGIQRTFAAFSQPLVLVGYIGALISIVIATFDLLNPGGGVGPANITYMINVALLTASAYLFRVPAFAAGAAALFFLPFTFFIYSVFGETFELALIPSAALAFSWAGLGVGYVLVGLLVERLAPRYSVAFPALGYLTLIAAVLANFESAESQSVVLGVIVVVAVASAILTHRGLTSSFVQMLAGDSKTPLDEQRRRATLGFVAVAALLSPVWSLEILAIFTTEMATQGLVLAFEAPVFVLVGMMVARRIDRLYAMPLYVAGYGMTAIAVVLTASDETMRLVTLMAATGTYAGSLAFFRRSGWVYPLLVSAHLTFAAFVTLQSLNLSYSIIGILFVPLALIMVGLLGVATRDGRSGGIEGLLAPWAMPFAIFGLVDLVTSLVLAASADWTGLLVTGTYAMLSAAAAHATRNRVLPYVTTTFITLFMIFVSRQFGLGWSQVTVVWASQGVVMWWGAQVFDILSRRRSSDGEPSVRFAIWIAPLQNAGLRLSWFALAFVGVLSFVGLVEPAGFGANQIQDVSAVMAILGLLYMGMAFIKGRVWFGYLAVGLLMASWTLQLVDGEIPYTQAYAIPVGLYLLGIAFFERRRARGTLPVFIEIAAVLLLVASSFLQSVVDEPGWAYASLLGVESLLLVLWGVVNRTKVSFVGGIVAFVVNVLYQTTGFLSTLPGAAIGLIIGLVLVTIIIGIEWRREQLIALSRSWANRFERWAW